MSSPPLSPQPGDLGLLVVRELCSYLQTVLSWIIETFEYSNSKVEIALFSIQYLVIFYELKIFGRYSVFSNIFNTDVITKIKNTFHTAGINSFSMYRYLTQPVDGIPKHTQRHNFKAIRLFKTKTTRTLGSLRTRLSWSGLTLHNSDLINWHEYIQKKVWDKRIRTRQSSRRFGSVRT